METPKTLDADMYSVWCPFCRAAHDIDTLKADSYNALSCPVADENAIEFILIWKK